MAGTLSLHPLPIVRFGLAATSIPVKISPGVDNPQPARTGFQGVGNPQPAAAVDNPEPANEACLWHCPSSLNEATGYTYAAHASETCSIPRAGTKNNITKHTAYVGSEVGSQVGSQVGSEVRSK